VFYDVILIGCLYHHGKGVEEDIGKAIDYLTQAHKLGNALATYHLYLIYSADGDRCV
jgi:TPR repeat protein